MKVNILQYLNISLRIFKKGENDEEMLEVIKEETEFMYDMYRQAVDEEEKMGTTSFQRWINDWSK